MKLPNAEIEKACATKDVRSYLNQPWLDVENKRLVATDGHIMAVHPVELGDDDTTGPVTLEAIKAARKTSGNAIIVNGRLEIEGVASFPRPDVGRYAQYEKVIPKKPDREPDLAIDANLLLNLAKALNGKGQKPQGIMLWLPKKYGSAIYAQGKSDAVGVIMPMKI